MQQQNLAMPCCWSSKKVSNFLCCRLNVHMRKIDASPACLGCHLLLLLLVPPCNFSMGQLLLLLSV
jgi:hypothetical protein